jgi:hypothetical protein
VGGGGVVAAALHAAAAVEVGATAVPNHGMSADARCWPCCGHDSRKADVEVVRPDTAGCPTMHRAGAQPPTSGTSCKLVLMQGHGRWNWFSLHRRLPVNIHHGRCRLTLFDKSSTPTFLCCAGSRSGRRTSRSSWTRTSTRSCCATTACAPTWCAAQPLSISMLHCIKKLAAWGRGTALAAAGRP